jgi:hypothetical protein
VAVQVDGAVSRQLVGWWSQVVCGIPKTGQCGEVQPHRHIPSWWAGHLARGGDAASNARGVAWPSGSGWRGCVGPGETAVTLLWPSKT